MSKDSEDEAAAKKKKREAQETCWGRKATKMEKPKTKADEQHLKEMSKKIRDKQIKKTQKNSADSGII